MYSPLTPPAMRETGDHPHPSSAALLNALTGWLRSARCFPSQPAERLVLLADIPGRSDTDGQVRTLLVALNNSRHVIHVPVVVSARHETQQGRLLAHVDGISIYDGPSHPTWLRGWVDTVTVEATLDPHVDANSLRANVPKARVMAAEQSNTSVELPHTRGSLLIKVYRTLCAGTHPDLEVASALASKGWAHTPAPRAHTTIALPRLRGIAHGTALATLACDFIPHARDLWSVFTDEQTSPERLRALCHDLGHITAHMHELLAQTLSPASSCKEEAQGYPTAVTMRVRQEIRQCEDEIGPFGQDVLTGLDCLLRKTAALARLPHRQRIHGDYHLGQILLADSPQRLFVLDFEGEPLRPVDHRRIPDFPLRDVASMLRSFDYARVHSPLAADEHTWERWTSRPFIHAWRRGRPLGEDERILLDALLIEKACYEARYEARTRPEWTHIPLLALTALALRTREKTTRDRRFFTTPPVQK